MPPQRAIAVILASQPHQGIAWLDGVGEGSIADRSAAMQDRVGRIERLAADTVDKMGPAIGHVRSTPGGAFATVEMNENLHADVIYLCANLDTATDDAYIQTIVHELTHMVMNPPEQLDPEVCGQVDDPKMAALSPAQRICNAESFGNFAFEAQFGKQPAYS